MSAWDGSNRRKEEIAVTMRLQSIEEKFDSFIESTKQREFITTSWRNEICNDLKDLRHSINGSSTAIGLLERVRGIESISKNISEHDKRIKVIENNRMQFIGGRAVMLGVVAVGAFIVGLIAKWLLK